MRAKISAWARDVAALRRMRRSGLPCRYRKLARKTPAGHQVFTCDLCSRAAYIRGPGRPKTCARMSGV